MNVYMVFYNLTKKIKNIMVKPVIWDMRMDVKNTPGQIADLEVLDVRIKDSSQGFSF